MKKKWKPTKDDFSVCEMVLEWLEKYYEQNWPEANITIQNIHNTRLEIPMSIDELETYRIYSGN